VFADASHPHWPLSVLLCNPLLTMLVVQVFVLLQLQDNSTKSAHDIWRARLLVLWPQGLEFASGSIYSIESTVSLKKTAQNISIQSICLVSNLFS